MPLPEIPPRSSSVPLDRLSREEETHDLGFITPNCTVKCAGLHFSSKLGTNQGEGIRGQLRFAAKQLADRVNLHTYRFLEGECGDIPSDQTLIPTPQKRKPTQYLLGQLKTLKSLKMLQPLILFIQSKDTNYPETGLLYPLSIHSKIIAIITD